MTAGIASTVGEVKQGFLLMKPDLDLHVAGADASFTFLLKLCDATFADMS